MQTLTPTTSPAQGSLFGTKIMVGPSGLLYVSCPGFDSGKGRIDVFQRQFNSHRVAGAALYSHIDANSFKPSVTGASFGRSMAQNVAGTQLVDGVSESAIVVGLPGVSKVAPAFSSLNDHPLIFSFQPASALAYLGLSL